MLHVTCIPDVACTSLYGLGRYRISYLHRPSTPTKTTRMWIACLHCALGVTGFGPNYILMEIPGLIPCPSWLLIDRWRYVIWLPRIQFMWLFWRTLVTLLARGPFVSPSLCGKSMEFTDQTHLYKIVHDEKSTAAYDLSRWDFIAVMISLLFWYFATLS